MNIFVAWSRAREDIDGHTSAPVHLSDDGDDEDDRTLCGVRITQRWEMDVWDAENLDSWVGCMRCIRSFRARQRQVQR